MENNYAHGIFSSLFCTFSSNTQYTMECKTTSFRSSPLNGNTLKMIIRNLLKKWVEWKNSLLQLHCFQQAIRFIVLQMSVHPSPVCDLIDLYQWQIQSWILTDKRYEAICKESLTAKLSISWILMLQNPNLADFLIKTIKLLFYSDGSKKKVLMLIDNCIAYGNIPNLTNMKMKYLPANTTSELQLLEQGIIWSSKMHFNSQTVSYWYWHQTLTTIDVLQSISRIVKAWYQVSGKNICFKKTDKLAKSWQRDQSRFNLQETCWVRRVCWLWW